MPEQLLPELINCFPSTFQSNVTFPFFFFFLLIFLSSLISLPSTLQHIVPHGSQCAGSRRLFPHPPGACTAPCSTARSRWRAAARAAHIQNPTGPTAADRLASKNDLQFLSWLLPFFSFNVSFAIYFPILMCFSQACLCLWE